VLSLSVVWLLLQSIAVYVGIGAVEKTGGYIDVAASNTHTPICNLITTSLTNKFMFSTEKYA